MFDIDRFKKGSPATPCVLTKDEQFHADVMQLRTMRLAPFFSQIGMSVCPLMFTRDVEIAATDEFHVFVNPVLFTHYTDPDEHVFVMVHEILHVVGHDCSTLHMYDKLGAVMGPDGKARKFIWDIGNIAFDIRNNFAIVASNIGKRPKDCCWDPDITDGTEDFATIYCRTYDKYVKEDPIVRPAPMPGKTFDELLKPGTASDETPGEARDMEMSVAIVKSAQSAQLAGELPGMIQRLVADAQVKHVAWHEKLRMQIARRTHGSGWNFHASDRRLIQRGISVPRRSSKQVGEIVIGIDVSGSIDDTDVAEFFAHIGDIVTSCRPKKVHLLWCDTSVRQHDVVENLGDLATVKAKPVPGGGGTKFTPFFDWVTSHQVEPQAMIILTDGYGDRPTAPHYPTLWACTTDKTQAFGDHVRIR